MSDSNGRSRRHDVERVLFWLPRWVGTSFEAGHHGLHNVTRTCRLKPSDTEHDPQKVTSVTFVTLCGFRRFYPQAYCAKRCAFQLPDVILYHPRSMANFGRQETPRVSRATLFYKSVDSCIRWSVRLTAVSLDTSVLVCAHSKQRQLVFAHLRQQRRWIQSL